MTVKPLTKEQKLEIVSQAMDAGAFIDINFHLDIQPDAPVKVIAKIFTDMDFETSAKTYEQSRWIKFEAARESKISGVLFFPQNQPLPKEWQDSGDMEEVGAE